MKKLLRYLVITLVLLVVVVAGAAAFIHFRGVPFYETVKVDFKHISTPENIARGQKLTAMLCANCHMNGTTGRMTGKHMTDAPPEFGMAYSANITADRQHGIGNYTDGELVYLLRTGVKKNGQYAPPYMAKLPHMSDEDINAIISFLRSDHPWVQAAATPSKPCEPSFLTKFLCNVAFKPLPMPEKPITIPDSTDKIAFGKYLAINLDCWTCHSGDFTKMDIMNPEKSFHFFGGGNKPLNLQGEVVMTSNLTPHKETGIGLWSEEKFIKALKYGLVDGQPALRYPMVPYTQLTDYEAEAIYAYLRTVPAIDNKVYK
ncbi:MAG: c-type cytochrome [Bacteroidota bacterium]|jgi:mono/diheme cytochrome c family protein